MKKRNFSEKKQIKAKRNEVFRNVLLILLSFLLCFQVYLIVRTTSVYNMIFNSSFFGSKSVQSDEDVTNLYYEYTAPEYIMANHDGYRDVFYNDSRTYQEAQQFIEEVNRNIFIPNIKIEYIEDGIFDKLTEIDSLYVSYPYERYPKYSAQFTNNTNDALSTYISSYTKLIIVPETGTENKNVTVYVKDSKTSKAVKISTSVEASTLKKFLKTTESLNKKDYSFAHELNLNSAQENSQIKQPAVLDKNIVIPLKNLSFPKVTLHSPFELFQGSSDSIFTTTAEKVMNSFGFTPDTARRYSDRLGVICVDEKATLKLSSDGTVEYTSLNADAGLNLTGTANVSNNNIYFLSFSGISRIINSVVPLAGNTEKSFKIRLTSLISESVDVPEYKFVFDYYINGIRISSSPYHGIEATVKNGKLTYMRIDLKRFESSSEEEPCEPLVSAIDRYVLEKKDTEKISIKNAFLTYPISKDQQSISARWTIY